MNPGGAKPRSARFRARLSRGAASAGGRLVPAAMKSGLQRRLLLMLLLPLIVFAFVSIYFDYRTAGNVALQKDQQLLRLLPLLADSVVAPAIGPGKEPLMLLAPAMEDFLKGKNGTVGFRLSDLEGNYLSGDDWISLVMPSTAEPEFHSFEDDGVVYRVAAQRVTTSAGELIVQVADGSDARQQWMRLVLLKVLLPNLVLVLAVGFAVNWAVTRALKPLLDLREAVERRSPRDLSAIDPLTTPAEVQPLVTSLNRLFGMVNDQAEGQRRFVADAAHQLRTPLAGLQAQVEAWAQAVTASGASAASGKGMVTVPADRIMKLRTATRRTSQLANQLLALSRADASAIGAQPLQRVNLKDLCESVLPVHLDAASAKHIDLGLDAQPAQVWGYEWLLRELLVNLVDNAVKYTPSGGTVTLRCGALPDGLLVPLSAPDGDGPPHAGQGGFFLEVEDDGPGIAPDERGKAVQRFYRVRGTEGEGNGLGLAISDEIARLHGSSLELDFLVHADHPHGLRVRIRL